MERAFKGVWIPKEIWLSKNLTLQEKVFLVEIESLDNENGCFASNGHFSEFFGLSKNRCSEVIKSLEKKGVVSIEYIKSDDRKNIEKRVIRVFEKSTGGIREIEEGYSEKLEGSNTSISNTKDSIYSIYDFWNDLKITQHRKLTQKMKSHINARLEEYSVDEIKESMTNYKKILESDEYFWTHKWTLQEFMRPNSIIKFVTDNDPFNNFKDTFKRKKNKNNDGWAVF